MRFTLFIITILLTISGIGQNISDVNNVFAFKLFSKIDTEKENIIISPYSIYEATGQVYIGANNKTKEEIANTLDIDKGKLNKLKKYRSFLKNVQDSTTEILQANAIWIKNDFKVKRCYKHKLKRYFNGVKAVLTSAAEINKWISKKTNNKITEIVDDNDVKSSELIITNAIYFNAKWEKEFLARATKEKDFYTHLKKIRVKMMYKKSHFNYCKETNYQAIELPYKGGNFSLIAILPAESNKEFVLNANIYNKIINNLTKTEVKLNIPKFKIKTSVELRKSLKKTGMQRCFTKDADFQMV